MATAKSSRAFTPFICQSCRQRLLPQASRPFSTTIASQADPPSKPKSQYESPLGALANLGRDIQRAPNRARNSNNNIRTGSGPNIISEILEAEPSSLFPEETERAFNTSAERRDLPHRLHVYAHKHNTHLTLVQPPRSAAETASSRIAGAKVTSAEQKKVVDVLMSMSTGNIGFKKAGRGTYDAAFQLAAFVLKQMEERGIWRDVNKLEVVLRGFGAGREAVTKALLGSEGRHARPRMTAVMDATRLKQGGPRSKKPRRLG